MQPQDDWDLIAQARTDPEPHFAVLVNRHHALVANLCFKFFLDHDQAQDATQDIFLQVYRVLDKVQKRDQPFVHWLCRVSSNHCRNVYRKNKRERRLLEERSLDLLDQHSFVALAPDSALEQREASVAVHRALKQVKPEERMALILSEMVGLDTNDIAGITRTPEHKVRRRLRRGKEKMRKIIAQETTITDATAGIKE